MKKRVKIVLLGLMIWGMKFIVGGFIFVILGTEEHGPSIGVWWASGISAFIVAIGLALALFLIYRGKGQNHKSTGWEAGIAWYTIILLMDLIILVGLMGIELELWFPLIFSEVIVLIIPIVVGYLLAKSKINAGDGNQ